MIFSNEKLQFTIMTIILSWAGLIILMSMYFTIPLTDILMNTFHVNETMAIWIGSIFSLTYALCCLIYGPLSDRYGRKIFLIFGISILTIATFICAFINNYTLLLIFRILQGIGAAAFVPISLAYIGDVYPLEKRKSAFGFMTSRISHFQCPCTAICNTHTKILGVKLDLYYPSNTIFDN